MFKWISAVTQGEEERDKLSLHEEVTRIALEGYIMTQELWIRSILQIELVQLASMNPLYTL